MFNIELKYPSDLKTKRIRLSSKFKEYDVENDTIDSIIIDICEKIAKIKDVEFLVSGFGQEKWPVDCFYDLSSVIGQIAGIISTMSVSNFEFQIDFYEQGIERTIFGKSLSDNTVELSCQSRTKWQPNPTQEIIAKSECSLMFRNIMKAFILLSEKASPELYKHIWFREWHSTFEKYL